MEALLRWQSPTLGMLVPERFMRTAERLGIIVQIGTWVLEGTQAGPPGATKASTISPSR